MWWEWNIFEQTFKVNRYTKRFRTSSFPLLLPSPQFLSFSQQLANGVSFHTSFYRCMYTPIPFFQQNCTQAWTVYVVSALKAEGNSDLDCLASAFRKGLILLAGVYILHLLHQLIYHGDFVCLHLSKRMKAFAWGRKTTRFQKWPIFSQFNLIYNSS